MMEIMNIVVGITILSFFSLGVICNIVVKRKYKKMFATMDNKGRDKNLLIIERDYRHGYLQDRVERIKVFVEKEYYEIKISNIPLYMFENFTITSVYIIVLLGLIFTFLHIALSNGSMQGDIIYVFLPTVIGLILGTVLMILHTILGLKEKREIFKVNLCNYLENELELFNGVEKEDEVNIQIQQNKEIHCENNQSSENIIKNSKFNGNSFKSLQKGAEARTKSIMEIIDENLIEDVLEEIMG
jgi:hypothetical protein